jgi:hypothetical protein
MKTNQDTGVAAERQAVEDPWAAEILRIVRRRELVYKIFIYSSVLLCLLMILVFWLKWDW